MDNSTRKGLEETQYLQARTISNGIWEVVLQRTNREVLFGNAVTAISKVQREAELVLSNLQRLSPDLASLFGVRTPTQMYDTPFTVICESDTGNFPFGKTQPVKQFLAVSYCWRHEHSDWPADGSRPLPPWPFSKPFVDAVLEERGVVSESGRHPDFRRECIFVDKMCIDQQDEHEKQRSIAMMDVIYKTCRKLMILLEDVVFTEAEVDAVASIDYDHITPGPEREINDLVLPHLISAWRKLEKSRWWSRSWCWHEFEVNEPWDTLRCSYYVHCATFVVQNTTGGTFKMRWLQLLWIKAMTGLPGVANTQAHSAEKLRDDLRWAIADNRISRYEDSAERQYGSSRSSIMARLYVINNTQSTIATDLISIALNLSGLALFHRGTKPMTRAEVVWAVATLALAAGEKSPLALMTTTMLMIDGQESWLSQQAAEFDTNVPQFMLGSNTGLCAITPHIIKLDLLFFEHSAQWATEDDMAFTYHVFPANAIMTAPPRYRDNAQRPPQSLVDQACEMRIRVFLAQACRCGLEFVLRLWAQIHRDVVQESYSQGMYKAFDANEALKPSAIALLEHLAEERDVPASKESSFLETLHLFLTWLTDPRSMYYISAFCLRMPCAEKDFALMSGPTMRNLEGCVDQKMWRLAIPTDLLDASCQMYRVWVLQPKAGGGLRQLENGLWENTNGEYTIVGKMLLLGEPDQLHVLPLVDSASRVGEGQTVTA